MMIDRVTYIKKEIPKLDRLQKLDIILWLIMCMYDNDRDIQVALVRNIYDSLNVLKMSKDLYEKMTLEEKKFLVNYILLDPSLSSDDRVSLFERPFKVNTFFNKDVFLKISKLFNLEVPIIPCRHCGSPDTVKCGIVHGKQRYQCKNCNKTFLRS